MEIIHVPHLIIHFFQGPLSDLPCQFYMNEMKQSCNHTKIIRSTFKQFVLSIWHTGSITEVYKLT